MASKPTTTAINVTATFSPTAAAGGMDDGSSPTVEANTVSPTHHHHHHYARKMMNGNHDNNNATPLNATQEIIVDVFESSARGSTSRSRGPPMNTNNDSSSDAGNGSFPKRVVSTISPTNAAGSPHIGFSKVGSPIGGRSGGGVVHLSNFNTANSFHSNAATGGGGGGAADVRSQSSRSYSRHSQSKTATNRPAPPSRQSVNDRNSSSSRVIMESSVNTGNNNGTNRDNASSSRRRTNHTNTAAGGVGTANSGTKKGAMGNSAVEQLHAAGNAHTLEDLKRLPDPPCVRVPLWCTLFQQFMVISTVFVVLIVVVTVEMASTTTALVEDRITADMNYARSVIAQPVKNAEQLLLASRLRYIAESEGLGRQLCLEGLDLGPSDNVFRDGLSTIISHSPDIAYMFVVGLSDRYMHSATGVRNTYECGIGAGAIYTTADDQTLATTSGTVGMDDLRSAAAMANLATTFIQQDASYRFQEYMNVSTAALSFTWLPYVWSDFFSGRSVVLLGGYVPIYVNRTMADGTVRTVAADPTNYSANVGATVVSSYGIDIGIDDVSRLMQTVTPDTDGAHTSVYDINAQVLVTTSAPISIVDDGNNLWPSGRTPLPALNKGYGLLIAAFSRTAASDSVASAASGASRVVVMEVDDMLYSFTRILSPDAAINPSGYDFLVVQGVPRKYYFKTIDSLRSLMIGLGVGSAFIIIAMCTAVVIFVKKGVNSVETGMALSAVLKNDRVVYTRSAVRDIDNLCVTFATMNAKLGAARAFMPQSMLTSDSDMNRTDDEDGHNDDGANDKSDTETQTSRTNRSRGGGGGGGGANTATDNSYSQSTLNASNNMLSAKERAQQQARDARAQQLTISGMQVKRVTVLAINTRGFHRATGDAVKVTTVAAELTQTIQSLCSQHRGVIDSFHGDHYILSFNAAKHNAQGPLKAVQCANDIRAALSSTVATLGDPMALSLAAAGLNANGGDAAMGPAALRLIRTSAFSMGVSAGRSLVGHLGSSDMKRFSIVGRAYSRALALERVCKLVADENLAAQVQRQQRDDCAHPNSNNLNSFRARSNSLSASGGSPSASTGNGRASSSFHPNMTTSNPNAVPSDFFGHVNHNNNNSSVGNSAVAAAAAPAAVPLTMLMGALEDKATNATLTRLVLGANTSAPVSLAVDASVIGEVEHSYFVQVVGKLCESSSGTNNNNSGAASYSTTESVIYAIRAPRSGAGGDEADEEPADEWMYAMKQDASTGYDRVLPAVNAAVVELLQSIHLHTGGDATCLAAAANFRRAIEGIRASVTPEDITAIGGEWGSRALERAGDLIALNAYKTKLMHAI